MVNNDRQLSALSLNKRKERPLSGPRPHVDRYNPGSSGNPPG
jgi:hypothetical protein